MGSEQEQIAKSLISDNKNTLNQWADLMDKQHLKVFMTLAMDEKGQSMIYCPEGTTLPQLLNVLEHTMKILRQSKPIELIG